eukprot:scaffold767_cov385-Pavlova_lutheri.AAC.8
MRGKQLGTSLRAIDESVNDANLIDSILSGLPHEYENKVDMVVTLRETDMLKLQNHLLQGEASILAKEEGIGQVAFLVNARRPKVVCAYCGRSGHTREKFWFLTGLPPHLQKGPHKTNEQQENIALCSYNGLQETDTLLKHCWIIDSGATVHICSQQELFTNINSIQATQKVFVGNGQAITAEGIGTCQNYLRKDAMFILKMKHVPSGKENKSFSQQRSALDWHRKLAHFGQMAKLNTNVLGIPPEDTIDIDNCETCIRAKQTRQHIQKAKEENTAVVDELIHMDSMGPITPASRNGEKYILSMLDEKSKIGVSKPLQRKSDTAASVINVLKHLERQIENKIKRI